MAATFWSAAMKVCSLHFILIFIASPLSLSQSIPPQNIQTFYPFFLPPLHAPRIPIRRRVDPPPPPDPAAFPPPPPPLFLPLPPSKPSKKAVGTAIGVTAASTVVLSALFFFFVLWYLRSRREKDGGATVSAAAVAAADGGGNENKPAGANRDEFLRFEGNLKAVIVDEDGLDVLYWRKLEGGEGKESFDRQLFSNIESDRKDEDKRIIAARGGGRKKPRPPVQEIPLLRGKSSTSQHPVWAEAENQEAASPPPLSVQAIPKTPSPPPSPKPDTLASSSSSEHGVSGNEEEEEEKVNPLHLDNVVHSSMDWNKIQDGSYKFDGDLMEALFGTVATNRKSPRTDSTPATPASTPREIAGPPSQISILETKKSQEFSAVIKSLNATRKEITNALDNGVGLDTKTLEKLIKLALTKSEQSDILGFQGPPTRLADAESFLFFILKQFPSAFHRFNAMFLRSRFGSEITLLKADFQTLESACNELRNSRLFVKLLEAILKAWNRMNVESSSRGNGHGFKLSALRKLSGVKSGDGTITVLQFVVQEVIRAEGKRCVCSRDRRIISNVAGGGGGDDDREKEYMTLGLPIVGGLSSEFSGVKKAAGIDYESLSAAHSALSSKASEIGNLAAQCGDDGGGFAAEMRRFLGEAEEEMEAVREEKERVMEIVKKTAEYFQRGSSNDRRWPPLQLFIIVKDFLGMIDEACVEIARNLQKKRPAGSTSSSLPSRTVRFPKLPADFLSE
nr:formin-like protein 8 [Ipomoea trifida]